MYKLLYLSGSYKHSRTQTWKYSNACNDSPQTYICLCASYVCVCLWVCFAVLCMYLCMHLLITLSNFVECWVLILSPSLYIHDIWLLLYNHTHTHTHTCKDIMSFILLLKGVKWIHKCSCFKLSSRSLWIIWNSHTHTHISVLLHTYIHLSCLVMTIKPQVLRAVMMMMTTMMLELIQIGLINMNNL